MVVATTHNKPHTGAYGASDSLSSNGYSGIIEEIEKTSTIAIINNWSEHFGVDKDTALVLAWCESRLEPNSKNPISSATGVYQIIDSTWWSIERNIPSNLKTLLKDRKDAESNIIAGLWLLKTDGIKHWTVDKHTKKCFNATTPEMVLAKVAQK